jgi:hypothetical protein
MHPKTRPIDWWKRKFVPQLYRTAKAMTAEAFADYILEKENSSKRRLDPQLRINRSEAQEAFVYLQRFSHSAEARSVEKDIIIVYDYRTTAWRGFDTNPPDATIGVKRETKRHEQLKGGYRDKLGDIEPCSKAEMLDEISNRYKCDLERAKDILTSCKGNAKKGALLYHRASNTWRGCFAGMPEQSDAVEVGPTLRQTEYRERYGKMPTLFHDYLHLDQSPRLKWIAEMDGCSIADAAKTHNKVWNVSKDRSKLAWLSLPKAMAVGVDYVEPVVLTDKMRAAIRSLGWSFGITEARKALTGMEVKQERVPDYLIEAKKLGDWESRTGISRNDGAKEEREVFAGSDWWRGYDERQAKQPAVKQQQESEVLAQAEAKESASAPHGWPDKLDGTQVGPGLIFKGIGTAKSLDAFKARVSEFAERYGADLDPEKIVSLCVEKGAIVEARGNVDGRLGKVLGKVGYRLA